MAGLWVSSPLHHHCRPLSSKPTSQCCLAHSRHSPAPPRGSASSRLEPLGLHSKFPIKALADVMWVRCSHLTESTRAGTGVMLPRQSFQDPAIEQHGWEDGQVQRWKQARSEDKKKKKPPKNSRSPTHQNLTVFTYVWSHYNFFFFMLQFLVSPQEACRSNQLDPAVQSTHRATAPF